METKLPTWVRTNRANDHHGWDPNKLEIPGYETVNNGTKKGKGGGGVGEPKDKVDIHTPQNPQKQDESLWSRALEMFR